MPFQKSVDVAIALYGKPHQSAVSLLSLLKHSGQWIDTIYVNIDPKQPPGTDFTWLYKLLEPYKVVYHRDLFHIGYFDLTNSYLRHFLRFSAYRYSVRYQYAWERSDKQYLLVMHNDMLFTGDLVGAYLANIGDAIGIGKIGQCWNCPAFKANLCDSSQYRDYRPDYAEVMRLHSEYGKIRSTDLNLVVSLANHWPLPECRLNEYVAMVNLRVARPLTMPLGPVYPLGVWGPIDTGTAWFHGVSRQGYHAVHFDFDPLARHSWTNGINSGNASLSNRTQYDIEEQIANGLLQSLI